jgi:hypothetical protein
MGSLAIGQSFPFHALSQCNRVTVHPCINDAAGLSTFVVMVRMKMAEREGFEPSVVFSYARFPGVCLKPLSHLSNQKLLQGVVARFDLGRLNLASLNSSPEFLARDTTDGKLIRLSRNPATLVPRKRTLARRKKLPHEARGFQKFAREVPTPRSRETNPPPVAPLAVRQGFALR